AQVSVAKVILAVFGVAVVVILIAVPTAIFLNKDTDEGNQRTFTLEDAFNNTLKPKSYNLRWISDHEYLHKSQGSVTIHNVTSGTSSEFLSKATFDQVQAYDYQLSADGKYVAFMSNYSKLWRHSFTATYSLYDLETGYVFVFSMYFQAYVWNYNVYVKSAPESKPVQVTINGEYNVILNGIPDWVYEEEMFSSHQGFWWSPGGKHLAYIETNDTEVQIIEYTWYGDEQYPSTVLIPYPKPGTPNPVVKLFVVDTNNVTDITEVVVPAPFGSGEHYLATVTWVTDERIAVQWLKRLQQHLILQIYDLTGSTWNPVEVKLDVMNRYYYFISIRPGMTQNSPFSKQLNLHATTLLLKGRITTPWLGLGKDLVLNQNKYINYISNILWTKQGTRNTNPCLTCALQGEDCLYNSAYFSHDASYYRMSCSGPGIPKYSIIDNRINKEKTVLENNEDFKGLISDKAMPTMLRDKIKLYGFDLWYQMYLPPGFDKSKKYPLLIDVYGGPCSQKADYIYRVGWSTYLASTEKIIVASFDGRGSGFQGDKLMHAIYKRLGTYEVEDQIRAAREFIDMGFIDKDRVAIWGWSYGGYVTSMVLGAGSGVFKCGMAVAPVSKWDYYDSIYTERYMMQPKENKAFYENSTVTERAKKFHSVQYLLVHGTADDNVHFQQAAEISEALVEEQVDFEAMWYTDKDHGLGGAAYQHLYNHMTHFLQRCFA
uniref:Dipeptidyl-peptidase 4 n=1 Tax=Sparus aurata TaxID=8175 RepID=A0A671YDT0_SPAAU